MLFEYHELSIYANNRLSICNKGSVLHWLNYNVKVSVERWPRSHVRYCLTSNFSTVVNNCAILDRACDTYPTTHSHQHFGRWSKQFADIVYRFWLQKWSKLENFAQLISWFLTSMFHGGGGWAKKYVWGLSPWPMPGAPTACIIGCCATGWQATIATFQLQVTSLSFCWNVRRWVIVFSSTMTVWRSSCPSGTLLEAPNVSYVSTAFSCSYSTVTTTLVQLQVPVQ